MMSICKTVTVAATDNIPGKSRRAFAPNVTASILLDALYEELLLGAPFNLEAEGDAIALLRKCRGYDVAAGLAAQSFVDSGSRTAQRRLLTRLTQAATRVVRAHRDRCARAGAAALLEDLALVRRGDVPPLDEDDQTSAKEDELREHAEQGLKRSPIESLAAVTLSFALDLNGYPDDPADGSFYAHHVRAFARSLFRAEGLEAVVELVADLRSMRRAARADVSRLVAR